MFNLFKKQKNTKIVEKEILVHSRLNFAHDPDAIVVFKFYFKPKYDNRLSDMKPDNVFVCDGIVEYIGDHAIYPVFKMPKKLPATRMISIKKIMCIGSITIDNETNEIEELDSRFTGMSLEEVNSAIANTVVNNDTFVTIMNLDESVYFNFVDGDDIDLETYERSITLNNDLVLVMDETDEEDVEENN
jgi:murein L,D-transpeptidase YafK